MSEKRKNPPEPSELERARMRKIQREDRGGSLRSSPSMPDAPTPGLAEMVRSVVQAEVAKPLSAMQHTVRAEMERLAVLNEAVLTREEVAKRLHTTGKTISKYVAEFGMPAARFGPEYRFIWSDVLKWMRCRPSNKEI